MDNREYIITEINKCKKDIRKIYAKLASVPATVIPSLSALVAGTYYTARDMSDLKSILLFPALIGTYYSLSHSAKVLRDYNNEIFFVSPYGVDDWSYEEPSLKEQLKVAKEDLTLYRARLIQEERKNRRR